MATFPGSVHDMYQMMARKVDKRSQDVPILFEKRVISPEAIMASSGAAMMTMADLKPILVSPDSRLPLTFDEPGKHLVNTGDERYPLCENLPLLIPCRLQAYYTDHLHIPYEAVTDSFLQYYFLSAVKQSGVVGAINAPAEDVHYQRHLFRMKECLSTVDGLVLDVGCDDPNISAGLLPSAAKYVGLDPFCRRSEPFRVIGFGEQLPFSDASFDCVVFNTSLDHILDWRRAISEAKRVLVPGGRMYVATLVWTDRADLATDAVHFHHFRDYELFGALDGWELERERRYSYKDDNHRHGLYVSVRKSELSTSTG